MTNRRRTRGVARTEQETSLRITDDVDEDVGTAGCFQLVISRQPSGTYSTGDISIPIPDVSTIEIPLTVPDTGLITDVDVMIRLNHTWDADLDISLVHPDGTTVELSTDNGGSSDNYGTGPNNCSGTFSVFDDAAASSITAGAAPFAGTFRPEGLLSALNGRAANGTWRLRITDDLGADVGTVGCFQLVISRQLFVCVTPPVLVSFARQAPAAPATNADALVFRATFSEAVTNVSPADFAVTGTTASVTGTSVVASSGNRQFDVTISGGDLAALNGTVGLDLAAGQNITDQSGDGLLTVEPATDETYTVDNTPPSITGSRTPAPNAFGWNNSDVTLSFACTDSLSGVDTLSDPQTISNEGADQSRIGICTDRAGNSASVTASRCHWWPCRSGSTMALRA